MGKLRQSARGKFCQIRIPGYCLYHPETVCLCHLNGGGMALKTLDIHGAYGCQVCHDIVDGKLKTKYTKDERRLMHLEGMVRTQEIMWKEGLIK